MDSVDGQRLSCFVEEFLGCAEQVDEMDVVCFGHLRHCGGVELEVFVVLGAVGEVGGVLEIFVGNGGEENEAGFAFAVVGGEMLFEVLVEGGFEVGEAAFAFERFIEAPISEDDVRVEIGSGVVGDLGFSDGGRQATGFHVEEVLGCGDFVASGVEVDLIGGEAEVANGEFVFWEGLMEKGF